MSALLPSLLSWVQGYGYLAAWLILFIAAVGVPLPVDLVLLAAGAFSAGGDFNVLLLALVAISGSVGGDQLGYGIGRWWGRLLLSRFERSPRWRVLLGRIIAPAEVYFSRHGGWAIFLSRFLVSSLGGEINLLAGATLYPYRRFLLADVTGETLGAAIPLSLGYLFGASWEAAGDLLNTASLCVLGAMIVLLLTLYLVKTLWRTPRQRGKSQMGHPLRQQGKQQGAEGVPVRLGPASEESPLERRSDSQAASLCSGRRHDV